MSKITKATFKSFVKKNLGKGLMINVKSKFDGMTDGCETVQGGFKEALPVTGEVSMGPDYDLGVQGIYLVGGGRDYFREYEGISGKGIAVSNCCGSFVVAVKDNWKEDEICNGETEIPEAY